MSDEHTGDPLQGLFSDDGPADDGGGKAIEQPGAAGLSFSNLFSSGEHDDQTLCSEGVPDGPDETAATPTEVLATEKQVPDVGARQDHSPEGTVVSGGGPRLPLPAEASVAVPEPTGRSTEPGIDHDAVSIGTADSLDRPPHVPSAAASESSSVSAERERMLRTMLATTAIGGGILVVLQVMDQLQRRRGFVSSAVVIAGYLLVVAALGRRQMPSRWRVVVLIGAVYGAALHALLTQGPTGTGAWYLLTIPVLVFALAGERCGIASAAVNVALYVAYSIAYRLGWPAVLAMANARGSLVGFVVPLVAFTAAMAAVATVHSALSSAQRQAWRLLRQHDDVLRAVQAVGAERQQRLERANAALRRQLRHSELTTEMGRLAAVGLVLDELVRRAVELMRQGTGADHVALYLLDEDRAYGQLHAETGDLRPTARSSDERIRVSDDMLLRQCVNSGRPQVLLGVDPVRDLTGSEPGSPFLYADARSALALPLVARGSVFGAISVQSRVPAAFDNTDVASLRTTVDQLSSAISNARLAQELREHLERLERLQQYYVRDAWEQFLLEDDATTYEYHRPEVKPIGDRPLPEVGRVLTDPRLMATREGDVSALLVPIVLREHVLGVFGLHRLEADQPWTEEQIELLAAISEQMGLTIENARLFAEARSRASQERRVRQVVARLRQSLDIEELLATAAQEMGDALGLEDLTIRLTATEEPIGG